MSCPRCNAVAPPDGRFCAQCGAQLSAVIPVQCTTRRQMTVLFCDLAGSTYLAQRLDPDDLLRTLHFYHDTVRRTAARFGGYTGRIIGDGVDIYFGYPLANEDDAARALHTALALRREVARIEAAPGEPLALRIGLATGVVAVSIGHGIVAGTTPNLAARIQALVPVGGIGVSPGTRRIAGAQFEFDEWGVHTLKGFDAPVPISLLREALSEDSRSAWRGRDASLPMVGRGKELDALLGQWQRTCCGHISGALIVGEPGLGKSRLATALAHALLAGRHTLLRLQCSPYHTDSSLRPFVQHLASASGFASGDSPAEQAVKLRAQLLFAGVDDPQNGALLAILLGVPPDDAQMPLSVPGPLQLQFTMQALQCYLTGLASHQPLLMIIEDIHWADSISLELLNLLLTGDVQAALLCVMTARSGFASPWQPSDDVISATLQRLPDSDALAVAAQQPALAALPAPWLASIVARSDGVPLFIEEMTRMLLERRTADHDGSAERPVPDTLMDLLTERLDRLPPGARMLSQLASVIGRDFDRSLLTVAAAQENMQVETSLQAMLDSGLVLLASADGERLHFKHALVEDTAYQSVPPKRRAQLHGLVANALLTGFRELAGQQPAMVARHLSSAGDGLQAAPWWQLAGGQALSRGAPAEAAGYLRAGVAALESAPSGQPRAAAELDLLSMLGPTTMVLSGPGSRAFGDIQQRSHALSLSLPGQPRLFPISYGWCLFNWASARLATASTLVDRLLDTAAERPGDNEAAMAANNMAGMVCFHRGQPVAAHAHLMHSTSLHDLQRDAILYQVYLMDFSVFGRFYLALSAQVLGHAAAAQVIAEEAMALAATLNQPHTMGFAMLASINTAVMRGDTSTARLMADRCIAFSIEYGFPEFIAMARVARGWAIAHSAPDNPSALVEGLAEVQAGLADWARTGFENWQPWFATLEAQIMGMLGLPALPHIDQHLARIAANGERQFESALLAERAAALARLPARHDEAAAVFEQAAALARSQGAAGWLERIARRRQQALADESAAVPQ